MTYLSPSYSDTYVAANAPDGWTSRATIQAENLDDRVARLSRLHERFQNAEVAVDDAIHLLTVAADERAAVDADITRAETLERRLLAALAILEMPL